ncbi:Tat (twin-arginine translocation) pathway signal sequence [Parafannyhessea umbonata]|uniref:Tat (Twin-arginine translocation) pathway signal sequence n=2 Tax=Parafannyhessea umbonata TaxID=604330 RepID=A0A1G6HWZ1_9ACTN|nr:ABC transporter substrate-binding protein [Parafannyhessea umbonata]SDB98668.1 Tat (twin-arginine translocation) pathway signal sequence [Parafannyhessea umbonata]
MFNKQLATQMRGSSRPYTFAEHKAAFERDMSRRGFIKGAGALAAAATLAGCGAYQGKSGDVSASAGEGTSAKFAPKSARKITFCLDYTPNTNHTGIYVAQAKGYFKDEGLTVKVVQPADGTAEAMIGSGQAQMGVSYQDYIANALSSKNPVAIEAVAAIIQHNTSGIMSRKADGITSAKKMEGHTYATWSMPVEQATIKQVMESDGGDFSKLKMVPYEVDDEVAGLKANMFDCVWVYEGWAVQNAKVQHYDVNYFSFVSMDKVFDFYTPVIAANDDFAKKYPDVVKAFVRAAKRGYEYAIKHPKAAGDILLDAAPELSADLVQASAKYLADQYQADAKSWGVIDKSRWDAYFKWLNDKNLVENKLDVNSGWTMDYLEA